MQRSAALALQVAALSAVVVPLRVLHAFEFTRSFASLQTVAATSRVAWSLVSVVGFTVVGFAHGHRVVGSTTAPRVLTVAGLAGLFGVLVGHLVVRLGTGVDGGESLLFEVTALGTYAILDAAMFGLLVLAGFALAADAHREYRRSS